MACRGPAEVIRPASFAAILLVQCPSVTLASTWSSETTNVHSPEDRCACCWAFPSRYPQDRSSFRLVLGQRGCPTCPVPLTLPCCPFHWPSLSQLESVRQVGELPYRDAGGCEMLRNHVWNEGHLHVCSQFRLWVHRACACTQLICCHSGKWLLT